MGGARLERANLPGEGDGGRDEGAAVGRALDCEPEAIAVVDSERTHRGSGYDAVIRLREP